MALGPGSIAFMGFDAGADAAVTFVALDEVAAGTIVFFTDRDFDGAAFGGPGLTWSWTATEPVEAGAVIRLSAAADDLTASHGSAAFSSPAPGGLAELGMTVYAFLGSDPETITLFLAAFTRASPEAEMVEAPTADEGSPEPSDSERADPAPEAVVPSRAVPVPWPQDAPAADIADLSQTRPPSPDFADYLGNLNNPALWGATHHAASPIAESASGFVVCFAAGTMIATEAGPRAVETLTPGDLVTTADHGSLPLRWVGGRTLDLLRHPSPHLVAPIMLARDAIADGVPNADVLVSPDHALRVDGLLVAAHRLRNGMTIRPRNDLITIAYHHLEFDRHTLVLAGGVPAESYRDTGNRGFFANAEVPVQLHPVLAEALDITAADDAIEPVWRRLRDRALSLGQTERAARATDDPGVTLWIDGQARPATRVEGTTYTFMVPPKIRSIRLMSRAARPSIARPWIDDRRQLGVLVSRITIGDGEAVFDVPLDHPALRDGWWGVERRGRELARWTDGDAALGNL